MYNSYVGGSYVTASPLELAVRNYTVTASRENRIERVYRTTNFYATNATKLPENGDATSNDAVHDARVYHLQPTDFLTGVATKTVTNAEEVMPLVQEAFTATTSLAFPKDIAVHLCTPVQLAQHFGPGYDESIQGFCRNRHGRGVSEIFVKRGPLAEVMLTLGHEIGHALTHTLNDARDEEAKAFAFSLAWMETICEQNIGGLRVAIAPNPAHNGLHNVAFNFVAELARQGQHAMRTFLELGKGLLSITKQLEQINR
ncbi:MAG TPA: hypothetical protein VLJ21_00275 [Candidatus Binatia bacterium]|nr:hypothetical protein [Candidatus Binatia bacterium]